MRYIKPVDAPVDAPAVYQAGTSATALSLHHGIKVLPNSDTSNANWKDKGNIRCARCAGTGQYIRSMEGKMVGQRIEYRFVTGGMCFHCCGKGYTTRNDRGRNSSYWVFQAQKDDKILEVTTPEPADFDVEQEFDADSNPNTQEPIQEDLTW